MMRVVKRLTLILIVALLAFGTSLPARAGGYYILYSNLTGVLCRKSSSHPSGKPYQVFFNVNIDSNVPAGALLTAYTSVNGIWSPAPPPPPFGDEIAADTPNYTATKTIELWIGGAIKSRTKIMGTCTDARTGGPAGPYGSIVEATVF